MDKFFLLCFLQLSLLAVAQRQDKVDFTHADVAVTVHPYKKQIEGTVTYTLKALRQTDSLFLDARKMVFATVLLDGKKVRYSVTADKILIHKKLRPEREYKLLLQYTANPQQALYFVDWEQDGSNPQVWTQGQGKYTSNWLPSLDDMTEKVVFDLQIAFQKGFTVIASGKLKGTTEKDGLTHWAFDMEKPMSSYLVAFAVGNYAFGTALSESGTALQQYYYPRDSLRMEPTYRHTKRIFDFLESEIGVPYPWQDYKQVPVKDFLYAGMENTGTTLFSDAYVIDSMAYVDKSYLNVNAHELAHQWFGNLVTETDASNHWLHEGFATYYAYLAEKEILGDDHFYWNFYATAKQLHQLSGKGEGEALTDPKASSATFYEKGAWALFILREVIGDTAFRQGIVNYLQKYQYGNATVVDFMEGMEKNSGKDLSQFKEEWLVGSDFPFDSAREALKKRSASLESYFVFQRELITSNGKIREIIEKSWNAGLDDEFKREIIFNYGRSLSEDFIKNILQREGVRVRQAVAINLERVPETLKEEFTTLLGDESYVTQENALYKLWVHFPLERAAYLDAMDGVIGLPNKNIRLLWLTLALITKDYQVKKRPFLYEELLGYTAPIYSFEVRMGAFQYIGDTVGYSDKNLLDLINACTHHSWQFQKFARAQLAAFMEKEANKNRLLGIRGKLKGAELRYLNSKLKLE